MQENKKVKEKKRGTGKLPIFVASLFMCAVTYQTTYTKHPIRQIEKKERNSVKRKKV